MSPHQTFARDTVFWVYDVINNILHKVICRRDEEKQTNYSLHCWALVVGSNRCHQRLHLTSPPPSSTASASSLTRTELSSELTVLLLFSQSRKKLFRNLQFLSKFNVSLELGNSHHVNKNPCAEFSIKEGHAAIKRAEIQQLCKLMI